MKMEAFDRLKFYQNYRQRYTVIPITTVRGPSKLHLIVAYACLRSIFMHM